MFTSSGLDFFLLNNFSCYCDYEASTFLTLARAISMEANSIFCRNAGFQDCGPQIDRD